MRPTLDGGNTRHVNRRCGASAGSKCTVIFYVRFSAEARLRVSWRFLEDIAASTPVLCLQSMSRYCSSVTDRIPPIGPNG